jgi:hypothetical protein
MQAPDAIGDVQRHLVAYSKSLADSLYALEHSRALSPADFAALRVSVVQAADEMDRLVAAVPDYAARVGPREALAARLCAGEAARSALADSLAAAVASAEARLAASTGVLQRALEAAAGAEAGDGASAPGAGGSGAGSAGGGGAGPRHAAAASSMSD